MFHVSKQALEELATNLWQANTLKSQQAVKLCENSFHPERTYHGTEQTPRSDGKKGEACKIQK
jgi:hypothetical protein